MKKLVIILMVLFVVGMNVFLLLPAQSIQDKTEGCAAMKCSQIELSDVNPGILPNLLKS